MLNLARFVHTLTREVRVFMPSGTTSNEAIHADINGVFRRVRSLHQSTLKSRLSVFHLSRLIAHNAALYRPTTRQWITSPSRGHIFYQEALKERERAREWQAERGVGQRPRVVVLRRPAGAESLSIRAPSPSERHRTVLPDPTQDPGVALIPQFRGQGVVSAIMVGCPNFAG